MLIGVAESAPPTTELRLKRFERTVRAPLPDDYRAFLLRYNGGHPDPAGINLNLDGRQEYWRIHFFFGLDDQEESCSLDWAYEVTKDTRPAGTIPIANDEFGNMFYLRHSGPNSGAVYFGPTPSDGAGVTAILVSESFSAFLEQLHTGEPSDSTEGEF